MRVSETREFGLALLAPAPSAELAAPVLAQMLDISAADAMDRLAAGPGILAAGLSRARARRAAALLGVMGLRVRVDAEVGLAVPLFDVALQVADTALRETVAERLSGWLDRPAAAIAAGFARPCGLVVQGLDWTAVCHLRRRVRALSGLLLLVSDPDGATYDLIAWEPPRNPARVQPLLALLRRLGLGGCMVTGAVAAGLDRAMVRAVLRRFPDCGLLAMNRDFQRFDLVLAGAPMPVRGELADFLAARTALPPQTFAQPDRTAGLRIECALSRADALAFQADYAAIGLETRLRLVLASGDGAG